jgi:hypothetical protein
MPWKSTRIPALSIGVLSLATAFAFHGSYSAVAQSAAPPQPPDHPQGPPPGWAPRWNQPIASSQTLQVGGATLQVDFAVGALDLTPAQILPWIQRAAQALTVYYGRFPVARVRVLIVPVADKAGVLQGTTWGDMGGYPSFTRMRLGQHTTENDLAEDWTVTHELVHSAFPSLPDDQHWMEEGLATYIEPIARVQAGELSAKQVWRDMIDGMPKGEPATGDKGMDRTHTWGRTYWGGGLFCLVADVNIRKQTHNRKGLRDALQAIVAAGGTIEHDWPLTKALEIGDKATGTTVLTDQYKQWSSSPSPVDLPALWKELGVGASSDRDAGAVFDPHAPLTQIRDAIMTP